MYLKPKCKTEFGKRNPVNADNKLTIELNLDVSLFSVLKCIKKNKN